MSCLPLSVKDDTINLSFIFFWGRPIDSTVNTPTVIAPTVNTPTGNSTCCVIARNSSGANRDG